MRSWTWMLLVACNGAPDPSADTDAPIATSEPDATGDPDPDGSTPTGVDPTDGCAAIPTFADGLAPTVEIHVSPDGDDAAGDGTIGAPYATIERAASDAAPGAAIRVHEGTYPGGTFLVDLRGTATAPIWVGGAPGEARPRIEGGGEGLHFVRAQHVVVHDLEVTGQTYNGINADDGGAYDDALASHHVVFQRLSVHDVGGGGNEDCIKLSGLRDFHVLDSELARCGGNLSGSGVDHVGCHRGVIARNTFTEMSGNAVQAKGGTTDLEIRANLVRDGGERAFNLGGSTGFAYFRPPLDPAAPNAEARDIRAIANVIEGSTAALAFVGCVDCLAANNTIVDPENWVARILQETTTADGYTFEPARDGRLVNNLVYFRRADVGTDVNVGPNTLADTFSWPTNLFFAHDDPAASEPDLPGTVVGTVLADPAFTTGYAIGADSPAAGVGTALPEVVADHIGACFGAPPSVGAYEVGVDGGG